MNKIKFDCTSTEAKEIEFIVERFSKNFKCDQFTLMMDITATHCNGNPLKLFALKEAEDFDFYHDVFGIVNNIDRETGKLKNCFSPRYSA